MNLVVLLRFLVPFLSMFVIIYIAVKFAITQKQKSRRDLWLNFILGLGLVAVGTGLFSLTPLIDNGHETMAELSLGGSLIILMVGMLFYVEYWHIIYKKIPWISKTFYILAGAGFILLLNNPWKIHYDENYGYNQTISSILATVIIFQGFCLVTVIILSLRSIKKIIDNKITKFDNISRDLSKQGDQFIQKSILEKVKNNLTMKKKRIDFISISFILGMTLIGIGFLPTMILIDSIGILVAVGPLAYILMKDNELVVYLLSQNFPEEMKNQQNNNILFSQQFNGSSEIPQTEIQTLINFIEKADAIYYKKNN